ncbi:MAG: hypothetical protein WD771_03205 [Gemmatimonadaceae bacterium]
MSALAIRRTLALAASVVGVGGGASVGEAQPLFRSTSPLEVTLTTNLRDLMRERDSTRLRWFGAEMRYTDETGAAVRVPVELRARGHFRRQSSNCAFPPLFLRAERAVRDSSILRGNPRVKIVTPCRTGSGDYQQYIFTEYQVYQTYALIDSVHHRTRLAAITYVDSAARVRPITVYAFFLEVADEVADEHELEHVEQPGVTWEFTLTEPINALSLFQYWIGNTDWSVAGLHNVAMFRTPDRMFRPVAYDFDWTGVVNPRYAFPNPRLGLSGMRERRHRGPCRTAAQWAPTVALFQRLRPAIDSIWSTPLPGQDARTLANAKRFLDQLWPVLDDPRAFKRELIDQCQPEGN